MKHRQTDIRIEAVYLAQTHVMKPDQPYFRLTGNRDALLKVQVVSASGAAAPPVQALVRSKSEAVMLTLQGPATLPKSFTPEPGVVQHRLDDSFTALIPARLVRPGLSVEVRAGSQTVRHELAVGAPTVVKMKMFDIHYFGKKGTDYPEGFFQELEAKWPVAGFELERVRNINFPELVIPGRPAAGVAPVKVASPAEYLAKTGKKFDGEQAAALQWVGALSHAGGNQDVAMSYVTIQGVPAGGQAGGYNGVGSPSVGIMNHELGHAFSLPHIGEQKDYPYRGAMHGIAPPKVFNEVHVGPTWGFDLPSKTFLPPTVQQSSGRWVAGTYKADPMQGGGTGDQEKPFRLRHFSDYNVRKMQAYLERKVALYRGGQFFKWDDATGDYTKKVASDGVHYPTEVEVPVLSVMASISLATLDVNLVYPPIGPYKGNRIRTFDPRVPADRDAARAVFAPKGGCDFCLKVTQGGKESVYLLPVSGDEGGKPLSLATAAVNLKGSDGPVTAIALLHTPGAERTGLPESPKLLARWEKK